MIRVRVPVPSPVRATAVLLFAFLAWCPPATAQTDDYLVVDNIEEDWVNLNLPSIRPMLLWSATELYAVNTHDSTVVLFDDTSGQPSCTFRTPWGPVSLAGWSDPGAPASAEQLLVVCSGSYVLAFLDRHTGETLNVLELPPEPRDILVDAETNRAYVSCAAQDLVVEIDLTAPAVTRQWTIPSKNPLALAFDTAGDVLVAPLFSGNNSGIHKDEGFFIGLAAGERGILDLADPSIAVPPGLPDEDCFRIVRGSGVVQPVARGMMTIVLSQGVNPATKQLWQVGTDANNKDPNRQSEPAIQGESVRNVLSIADLPDQGSPPNEPALSVDLDDSDPLTPGVQIDPTRTVGQPCGLHFAANGFAFVTGLLTDNVTILSPAGKFVDEWDLPDGSIPRAVQFSEAFDLVFVYCWGTNKIESYHLGSLQPFVTLDLGFDPTPTRVQQGRRIFYSAFKSRDNNASCASCHVEGKADNVVWNLSDDEKDGKGPMFTQVLSGIDRLAPFHWRGERPGLIDFNGAFEGLLGSQTGNLDETPGGEFDLFEEFVLSMRNPANPNQDPARVISDAIDAPKAPGVPDGNATNGQPLWISNPALNCERCHMFPMSTGNDITRDEANNPNPREQWLDVAAFHEIYRKQQDADPLTPGIQTVSVSFVDPTLPSSLEFPVTGFGFSHAGVTNSLNHFVRLLADPALPTPLSPQQASDITDFAWQWDNGMGMAVHKAFLLNQQTEPTVGPQLATYLEPQSADERNCGIAVYGTVTQDGNVRELAWTYDRQGRVFVCGDTSVPDQPLSFFIGQAQSGEGSNVFVGTPVGSAERFAVDADTDDLFDFEELNTWGSDPHLKDSDGDGFWDGHEAHNGGDPASAAPPFPDDQQDPSIDEVQTQWFTTKVASLVLRTDEPTRVTVDYSTPGQPPSQVVVADFEKVHRVLLGDLLPSTGGGPQFTYSGTITVHDLADRSTSTPIPSAPPIFSVFGPPPITTRLISGGPNSVVVEDLEWTSLLFGATPGGKFGVQATARIQVRRKTGGPPWDNVPGLIAICRVLEDKQPRGFKAAGSKSFSLAGTPYTQANFPGALAGPFLISQSATDSNGAVTVTFSASGFQSGETLTLNIEGFGPPTAAHTNAAPDLQNLNRWSMPDTQAENRCLNITF